MVPSSFTSKNGKIITLREAQVSDAEAMIRYMNAILTESDSLNLSAGEFDISKEKEEEIIQNYLDTPNKLFLLALDEENIIGAANMGSKQRKKTKHVGHIGISIRTSHQRNGIASALMEEIIRYAKASHIIKRLELEVFSHNTAAIQLYTKYGFEIEGTLRADRYIDGTYINSYVMGLLLED